MPLTRVFAINSTPHQVEAAVDRLVESGVIGSAISVLHPDNASTREFAKRKGTRPPASTTEGKTASVPLGGTLGVRDPGDDSKDYIQCEGYVIYNGVRVKTNPHSS